MEKDSPHCDDDKQSESLSILFSFAVKDFISASGGSASNYYSLSTSTHHRNHHHQGVAMSKLINNPTAIDLNLMDDISYADD